MSYLNVLGLFAFLLILGGVAYTASVSHRPEPQPVPAGTPVVREGTLRVALLKSVGGQDIAQQVFWLEDGQKYRLVLSQLPVPNLVNGTRVRVTGILVVPSSWNGALMYSFDGDIYVQNIVGV